MKNSRQIFLILVIFFFSFSFSSFASTATVNVQSITNSSSNSTTTTTGNTHIRIETNGVVKECDSKNGDCTYLESDDGSSKVNVNSGSFVSPTVIPTPFAANSALTAISEEKKSVKENELSFFQEIKDFIKSIFETLKLEF